MRRAWISGCAVLVAALYLSLSAAPCCSLVACCLAALRARIYGSIRFHRCIHIWCAVAGLYSTPYAAPSGVLPRFAYGGSVAASDGALSGAPALFSIARPIQSAVLHAHWPREGDDR